MGSPFVYDMRLKDWVKHAIKPHKRWNFPGMHYTVHQMLGVNSTANASFYWNKMSSLVDAGKLLSTSLNAK